jgi:hypothetical protein
VVGIDLYPLLLMIKEEGAYKVQGSVMKSASADFMGAVKGLHQGVGSYV